LKLSKISLATLAVMAILVLSGISIPAVAAKSYGNQAYTFPSASPSYVGSASAFLSGPSLVTLPSSGESGTPSNPGSFSAQSDPAASYPNLNPKPYMGSDPAPTGSVPPTVNCSGFGTQGCDSVVNNPGGANTNPNGINAYNNLVNAEDLGAYYNTIEPPDQGLCAGNGYVMEIENQGELQVYNSNLRPVSGIIGLDTLMGLTSLGWSSGGDIMCQYDSSNGGHWFITQIVSTSTEASGGPFSGCFGALVDGCREGIAVSKTSNPLGPYYVYFLDPNKVNNDPGSIANPYPTSSDAGVLLNDFAKTATTRDSFEVFYDEFNLYTGFFGAQEFAFSKAALETGLSKVNVAYENMGNAPNLYPIPSNGAYQPVAITSNAWYQVIPAQTTDPSQYDNQNGGTGFMLASLDFFGTADNRVAVFDWTGLSALNSPNCNQCGGISFGGQLLTGVPTYQDEGAACLAEDYLTVSTFCGLGAQEAGPIPLGDNCVSDLGVTGVTSCPEGGIATNGDGATEAFLSDGVLWTAVNTVVNQTLSHQQSQYHLGATYWGISVDNDRSGVTFSIQQQGVVSAAQDDLEFPSMAAADGTVLMAFTLSGTGGQNGAFGQSGIGGQNGGYFPSTAYLILSSNGNGFGQNSFGQGVIHIADQGRSPTDGFTEYQSLGTSSYRPRWGDYSQAVFDPSTGKFYFGTEYIEHPNCGDKTFSTDPTCGGTRSPSANWGSSINSINP
jgi:hypothetical protein